MNYNYLFIYFLNLLKYKINSKNYELFSLYFKCSLAFSTLKFNNLFFYTSYLITLILFTMKMPIVVKLQYNYRSYPFNILVLKFVSKKKNFFFICLINF
jgi:hypothetical protein